MLRSSPRCGHCSSRSCARTVACLGVGPPAEALHVAALRDGVVIGAATVPPRTADPGQVPSRNLSGACAPWWSPRLSGGRGSVVLLFTGRTDSRPLWGQLRCGQRPGRRPWGSTSVPGGP